MWAVLMGLTGRQVLNVLVPGDGSHTRIGWPCDTVLNGIAQIGALEILNVNVLRAEIQYSLLR
jgi:hypothetical protein